jgi:hypothetical protein
MIQHTGTGARPTTGAQGSGWITSRRGALDRAILLSLRAGQVFILGSEIMNDANHSDSRILATGKVAVEPVTNTAALKPKGACWYCNQPLDNVRRFCNKTCADDYRTEEEAFKNPSE